MLAKGSRGAVPRPTRGGIVTTGTRNTVQAMQAGFLLGNLAQLALAVGRRVNECHEAVLVLIDAGEIFRSGGLTVLAGGLLERLERFHIEAAAHQTGGGPGPG
jgi:hypothetical protein